MGGTLVINSALSEVRVALLENGTPVEVYIERHADKGVVGNIYKGKVVRVLPGMQAAFVEIGIERTAFLYVNDALPRPVTPPVIEMSESEAEGEAPQEEEGLKVGPRRGFRAQPAANIADVLTQGQELLLQVQKEPLGTKGARVTRHIAIPGRYLVFMPFSAHIGVSHRITATEERDRLKNMLVDLCPPDCGFIVRTAAENIATEELTREAQMLIQLWQTIERKGQQTSAPNLVFSDLDLVMRATRDMFTEDVEKIVIDKRPDFERVRDLVLSFAPSKADRVHFYDNVEPIFDHYGVEVELERALDRRVWLKSGGYIIIDQAEALTVVDVNSGRFVGKSNLEDTITQINLEAVKEVAYQLRLRNIGGIIIIDFIDMANATNRELILSALAEALTRDKAKTSIVRMSEIGLIEMTRKRVRESIGQTLTGSCPYCKGRGFVKTDETVAIQILRALRRQLAHDSEGTLLINMQPEVADRLYESHNGEIEMLEQQHGVRIIPVAREGYHREQFEIVAS